MSDRLTAAAMAEPDAQDVLAWECLGRHPARVAFFDSLAQLLRHPVTFFRRMAVTGGLHEPVSFLAVLVAVGVLLALPAGLAYVGLTAPDVAGESLEAYTRARLPARAAVLAVVLLPLIVVASCVAMVLLGTLYHVGGRLFARGRWEGSVSVWLYSSAAALVPLVVWIAVLGAISLVGYFLGIPWPDLRDPAGRFAEWTVFILGPAALLASAGLMVCGVAVGRTQAFRLDPVMGAASGLAGLVVAVLAVFGCVRCWRSYGTLWGAVCVAGCVLVLGVLAVVGARDSRRSEGSA
jgi:hypothetical protein